MKLLERQIKFTATENRTIDLFWMTDMFYILTDEVTT